MSWEPDLWGRVRLSVENAVDNAQVSAADLENVRLSQQALLATDYFLLAAQDMQMAVLERHHRRLPEEPGPDEEPLTPAAWRRAPTSRWRKRSSPAQGAATDLRIARAQDENAIAVLTGRDPASLDIASSKIAGPPPPLPTALPSYLLERRPDIAANERQVAAANANIGHCGNRLLSNAESYS